MKFAKLHTFLCALSVLMLASSAFAQNAPGKTEPIVSASELETKPTATPAATEFPFSPVSTGASGIAADGIAVFYPAGLDPKSAQHSPALLTRPILRAPVPSSWTLRPVFTTNGSRFRASLNVPAEVDLYGGGEVTGPLRRNGTAIKLWNTDNLMYGKDKGTRLYQSHPWMMGVRPDGSAFGVLFDSTWKAEMECKESIRFTADGPGFAVIVVDRSSPEEVLKALGVLTGRMELPPLWALGYQQCRWSYCPDTQVKSIADEFRARKLPCDVIWMDIDYMDGFRVFTFDKTKFPDPKGLNDYLHEKGFKAVWMLDPGLKVDNSYSVYNDGREKDVFVKTAGGDEFQGLVWPGPCAFPDFTRPETRAWWAGWFPKFLATGIDGVWNDMNEPCVVRGPDGTMPVDNLHRGGGEFKQGAHLQYHNIYGMLMARSSREGLLKAKPDRRPFVLTRSNFLGGQRYCATWTGDNASSEKYMKISVPMSLTLGLSGQPFNGPDLGGYSGQATPELWSKWVGFGALFPFARGHAEKNRNDKEPWAFGEGVERTARIALERRYRLLPYFYTLFRESSVTGMPVMRPMFMADVKDPSLRREEQAFLLGKDLMVVPSWANQPALPRENYPVVSLIDGDSADPDQATLRIRPGAIIPLGRVIQNTTEKSLDPLTLLVCLDAKGQASGKLYEDDGEGFGYRKGDYSLTTYTARREGGKVVVSIGSTEGKRPRPNRTVTIQAIEPSGTVTTSSQSL